MLLMFPAIWSILIVLKEEIDIYLILLFAYGSFIMRSAGCIINDIIDRKFDKNVKRTKSRPLASQNLESTSQLDEATEFLMEILKDGSVPSTEVLKEAEENGIADRTLKRAKNSLGVKSKKITDGNGKSLWAWELPQKLKT